MARMGFRYTPQSEDWFRARIKEYGNNLRIDHYSVSGIPKPSDPLLLFYDRETHDSKQAARDIASSYAHEIATEEFPSWCFDCRAMRHRGDRCDFSSKALSAEEADHSAPRAHEQRREMGRS